MGRQKISFWLMLPVGTVAFVWLFAELVRVFLAVVKRSAILSIPLDGVIQHKVGELLVAVPLFLILLLSNIRLKEKVIALAAQMQMVMIVGGLLNGLAWYSLRERESWDSFFRIWCVILLVVGLFGSQIAKWLVGKTKEKPSSVS